MVALQSFLLILIIVIGWAGIFLSAFWKLGDIGVLLSGIIFGGIGGGFTSALITGASTPLNFPSITKANRERFGLFGDIFVGLMAGLLGVSIACRNLKMEMFTPGRDPLIELLFVDFGVAFVSGFLGLRLIKVVSDKFLIAALKSEVEQNTQDTADLSQETATLKSETAVMLNETNFLKAQEAFREKQFEVAADLFRHQIPLDGQTTIRAHIGLGRALNQLGKLGDAIAAVDEAIRLKGNEKLPIRVAVAYWNRACYRARASSGHGEDMDQILSDLREAIRIQPSYRFDLGSETDLKSISHDARFTALQDEH